MNELTKMIYVSSCEDLANHGIKTSGWFWINSMPESFNAQPSKMFCSFNKNLASKNQEFSSDKILILSGSVQSHLNMAEIIDLSDGTSTLEDYSENNVSLAASGGLVKGSTPIICGGGASPTEQTDECHFFGSDSSKIVMNELRYGHKATVVNDKLWLTGGLTSRASTEFVDPIKKISEDGPYLPYRLHNHCVVTINETFAMIIGGEGFDDVKSSTYFHDFDANAWIQGPDLLHNRSAHACAILTTPSSRYIIVTGGIDGDIEELASTEILDLNKPIKWIQGKRYHYFD